MRSFNKYNDQSCNTEKNAIVLNSYVDFCNWYMSCHDFSMFSQNEIDEVLNEEKPDMYPCIPLFLGPDFEVTYICTDLIKSWGEALDEGKRVDNHKKKTETSKKQ
jgi:hypothetical protein